jgi:hypothetical protein
MLACQQPNIGSGATAIGSTVRAPDEGKIEYSLAKSLLQQVNVDYWRLECSLDNFNKVSPA